MDPIVMETLREITRADMRNENEDMKNTIAEKIATNHDLEVDAVERALGDEP